MSKENRKKFKLFEDKVTQAILFLRGCKNQMIEADLIKQYALGRANYPMTIKEALSVYNLLYNNKHKKKEIQKSHIDSQPIPPTTDNDAASDADENTNNDVGKNGGAG